MNRMTWDEFKALVDAEIEAQGADGSVEVWYIDVDGPEKDTTLAVNVSEGATALGWSKTVTVLGSI